VPHLPYLEREEVFHFIAARGSVANHPVHLQKILILTDADKVVCKKFCMQMFHTMFHTPEMLRSVWQDYRSAALPVEVMLNRNYPS
jgi:hypothetical protein